MLYLQLPGKGSWFFIRYYSMKHRKIIDRLYELGVQWVPETGYDDHVKGSGHRPREGGT